MACNLFLGGNLTFSSASQPLQILAEVPGQRWRRVSCAIWMKLDQAVCVQTVPIGAYIPWPRVSGMLVQLNS